MTSERTERLLAPSDVADVLRGARDRPVRVHPELATSPLFDTMHDLGDGDLVAHTLAMHAKGFLVMTTGSRRLSLDASGQSTLAALAAKTRDAQTAARIPLPR